MSAERDDPAFVYDERGHDVHRPAWMCSCGTTLFPAHRNLGARGGMGGLSDDPPRCPSCVTAGYPHQSHMRKVTLDIADGWGDR